MRRTAIHPVSGPLANASYPAAVAVDDLVFISGLGALAFANGLPEAARVDPRFPFHSSPTKRQTAYLYGALRDLLQQAATSLEALARVDQFHPGRTYTAPYLEERDTFLTSDRPASTALDVIALAAGDAVVELDGIAAADPTNKRAISTAQSLQPAAGYSQGILVGDWHFLAGATASDYVGAGAYPGALGTGVDVEARVSPNFWYGSAIKRQTTFVMRRKLQPILEAAGMGLTDVVKVNVYLTHFTEDLASFHEAWSELFPENPPALVVTPVRSINPIGGRIEITPIAHRGGGQGLAGGGEVLVDGPTVRAANLLFFSTQLPRPGGSAAEQVDDVLEVLEDGCRASGGALDALVKLQVFVADPLDLADVQAAFADRVGGHAALTFACVPEPLATPGARLMVDAVAAIAP
ncbi:MAG: hypothetical protein IT307_07880 [Chloroflexi bacterium]|nr:hypothetical protein [Chloroflexota bacterium]